MAINTWYGPFYDMVQKGLTTPGAVSAAEFYWGLADFAGIAFLAITIGVLNLFFVSHYIFRWRTAMNDYYMSHWPKLRHIEVRPSVCRKIRCAFPPRWNSWASAS